MLMYILNLFVRLFLSGVKRVDDSIKYLIKFNDNGELEELPSVKVVEYWPKELIEFLLKHTSWTQDAVTQETNSTDSCEANPSESGAILEAVPKEILCNLQFSFSSIDQFIIDLECFYLQMLLMSVERCLCTYDGQTERKNLSTLMRQSQCGQQALLPFTRSIFILIKR